MGELIIFRTNRVPDFILEELSMTGGGTPAHEEALLSAMQEKEPAVGHPFLTFFYAGLGGNSLGYMRIHKREVRRETRGGSADGDCLPSLEEAFQRIQEHLLTRPPITCVVDCTPDGAISKAGATGLPDYEIRLVDIIT